ncbi:hypothetical protein TNCV_404101 [Trichonephila clavipes]|nr:hypothetical protein TNCV_404101 [Trichonephila clavipes]
MNQKHSNALRSPSGCPKLPIELRQKNTQNNIFFVHARYGNIRPQLGPLSWSLVYADKPQTLDHLEDNIRRVIADIRPQMLEKVIENWTSRLDYIRASRGSPMPEIIFKM